ncbi:MAG: hypothetical protein OEZ02_10895 [Anaerolineae bacterium]|nr:hypothetical protein [Anaerolineae bacterium]
MKSRNKLVLVIASLILPALACFSGGGTTPAGPPDPGAVETSVAATMTAMAAAITDTPVPPPVPAVLRVAFVDGGDLWLWMEGIPAVELHDDAFDVGDVRLSDDGQVIAFSLVDNYDFRGLWAINTDGSSLRMLVDAPTINSMSADPSALGANPWRWDFVPGSHTLAFNTHLVFDGPGLAIQNDLRLLNADTSALSTLLAPGDGGEFYYSPEGSQIAIVTPTDISLINADGSNRRDAVLTYASVMTYSEYQYYAVPRWSTDGSQLRVVIPSPDMMDPAATIEVFEIPLDGTPPVSVGLTAAFPPLFVQESTLSPDLSKVAFTRRVGAAGSNTVELHFVEPATGTMSLYYTGTNVEFENWSPGGTHFVYAEGSARYMGALGGGSGLVAGLADVRKVVWIDATRYLFTNGSTGSWQLQLGVLGGSTTFIVSPAADFVTFDFSY